jgi:hypothetical protein
MDLVRHVQRDTVGMDFTPSLFYSRVFWFGGNGSGVLLDRPSLFFFPIGRGLFLFYRLSETQLGPFGAIIILLV